MVALATCFVGAAALWWLYFDSVARFSKERLRAAGDRGRLARDAFTYLHLPIVAGIIASAVADEITIAHPGAELDWMGAAMVLGGPLLYLLGHQLFRLRMVGSVSRLRLVAIAGLALLVPFATALPALAAAAAATLVLCATAAVETFQRTRLRYG